MDSRTLVIKAQRQQLFSMFYLRGLICSAKNFLLVLVLLCATFILVTCKHCSVNEEKDQLEFEACRSYKGNFGANNPDVFDGHAISSELWSKHSQQHILENVCPSSNSFCFPSTINGLLVNEIDVESKASDTSGVQGFSSGLKQTRSNLTLSPEIGIFRFLGGKTISCSLYQEDYFNKFPSIDEETKSSQCVSPILDKKIQSSKSGQYNETVKSGFLDGLSAPSVEIRPSLLDWGQKNMYNPSLAFFTVKNVDSDGALSVYDPYSSNSQFYPCNISEIVLAPGEVASICFVFFPTQLGVSSAQLVLQTSFGGFLIQAKGVAIDSPYLIKPLSGLDVSSNGRWRNNLSLFNPFDDTLYVEEVTAWISTSSGNTSRSYRAMCSVQSMEDFGNYAEWLDLDRGEVFMRPHKAWEIGPQKTENIIEIDVSSNFEGNVNGAFCLHLSRPASNEIDTVIIPLEADLNPSLAPEEGSVSVFLEALVPYGSSESTVVALSVRNDSPFVVSIMKISEVGESANTFKIKYVEGLILFPSTITQVAIFNYDPEVNMNCKLLVVINDTRNSQIEIPCKDVISACSGRQLDASVGYTNEFNNVEYIDGRQRSFVPPTSGIKVEDTREADELVLRNWKSQASTHLISVLDANELVFPMVQVGNYSSKWISVKNPSQEPVMVQLILNSGEVIENCKKPEILLQPSSSSTLVGNKSIAPTKYGFSIAKNAVTEAYIHPHGSAFLGPILFQPSNRCEWRSSVLIRNNLSGVEWLSLRGFGGSLSLVLLEGSEPVQSLEFKLNLSTQLNFSSSDIFDSKSPSCTQPLTKEVYAKNTGDLPLEVNRIQVSGAECNLDGFSIHKCKGFSLEPGESLKLMISYKTDFSGATVQRDLELVLATGILVIPMKASLPIYVLNFCKRSLFWIRLKKASLVLIFATSLMYLLVCLLVPRTTAAFASEDLKGGTNNSFGTIIRSLNSLHMHFISKNIGGTVGPAMNSFVRSIDGEEEALLLESASRCSNGKLPDQKQTKSSLGSQPKTTKSSSVENSDPQSRNLRVSVGKEKGRRQRKKKSSNGGTILLEVSSSQSGNSTPSSPSSPIVSKTPKRPLQVSPGMKQCMEAKNPFAQSPNQQHSKSTCSPKVNILDNEATLRHENHNRVLSVQEKPILTRKVAGRAVLLPSATFPSAGRVVPTWACQSPYLASTSTIAPHARAPGTKISNQKTGLEEKNVGVEEKMVGVEENFTYDIWGDHLFGVPSTPHKSKEVVAGDDFHSFFVRDPQTLVKNSLLNPVSSMMEANK
ncbi:hypothetical protein ACJIZ3_008093 [Penstemon smallii]|uniref:Transmembrane protein 131-like N-terminal domain-containing protein n=1 Tax=Penstemon smallii TaxID=265156 RepID=A0ABD3T8S8_9LAMI